MVPLTINADDFGMSNVFNDFIIELLVNERMISTTVMVKRISKAQKLRIQHLRFIKETLDISEGLQVEFTNDQHLEQIQDQYRKFIDLFESAPSHMDVHKEHLHTKYHGLVGNFCKSENLPFKNHGKKFPVLATTSKKYFNGSINGFGPIYKWLNNLEDGQFFELVCHPERYYPHCYFSLNAQCNWDLDHIDKINPNLKKYSIEPISFNYLNNSKTTQVKQG